MEKEWLKELVRAEQQMEESGVVDITAGFDPDRALLEDTFRFLEQLKIEFADVASAFNEMKTSTLGRIKIYGIAKTQADFMLFRNGFKMIFSFVEPGKIAIRMNFITAGMGATQAQTETAVVEPEFIQGKTGIFGDVQWQYRGQDIRLSSLVRHYMTRFIRESAN